jgi:hypothetical protein
VLKKLRLFLEPRRTHRSMGIRNVRRKRVSSTRKMTQRMGGPVGAEFQDRRPGGMGRAQVGGKGRHRHVSVERCEDLVGGQADPTQAVSTSTCGTTTGGTHPHAWTEQREGRRSGSSSLRARRDQPTCPEVSLSSATLPHPTRGRWLIDAVYVSEGKIGKEGKMANGGGDGDGRELDPEVKLACAEQELFECVTLEDEHELER